MCYLLQCVRLYTFKWSLWLLPEDQWDLRQIIIINIRITNLRQLTLWLCIHLFSRMFFTYVNTNFFSGITEDVTDNNLVIKYLVSLVFSECVLAVIDLYGSFVVRQFLLEFMGHFHETLHNRLLSTEWNRIKYRDPDEMRHLIDQTCEMTEVFMDKFIVAIVQTSALIISLLVVLRTSPFSLVLIIPVLLCTYRYFQLENERLLKMKFELRQKQMGDYRQYWRVSNNIFEYVIHRETTKIIKMMKKIKIVLRQELDQLDLKIEYLLFQLAIVGKICVFAAVSIYLYHSYGSTVALSMLPLYHHVTTLVDRLSETLSKVSIYTKAINNYARLKLIMDESVERIQVSQYSPIVTLELSNLEFSYKTRSHFRLTLADDRLVIKQGESILIRGKSGAGKSTFYDIICGVIPTNAYTGTVYVNGFRVEHKFHTIECARTIGLQDSLAVARTTVYSIVTEKLDYKKHEDDPMVWSLLELVEIAEFVRTELNNGLHETLENKLSGGEKNRLLLARTLYRAEQNKSSLLILDEPDKGLPAEMTLVIIQNIIRWFRQRGILIISLHTKEAHTKIAFDQVYDICHGSIKKVDKSK